MGGEVVLLDFWASPFGMRARIALAEKGVKYEYREENLANKGELLLKSNPVYKKIPVLIHDGKSLSESLIIVQYIDEVWKNPPLLPEDAYERAVARFWADFADKKLYDSGTKIWKSKGEAQASAVKEFIENLKILEGALGDEPFFGGEKLGFVDVMVVPFVCWFHAYEVHGGFSVAAECPKIDAWAKRCMERESVSKALQDPEKILEFVGFLKKKYGVE
ncbi:probable glutathione S-transferase parC [Amborella trichopoda]|uniref:Glutathione S-transferase n=1 Tax=Amborella trichopoda TaxID=13333 RepID=W1NVG0_AMBTC|nr:probable glutathione S-transferase parC [Amborella trichopoda]ERM99225.1 hypothetical protein AMTR_s00092p00118580 [Amborella trichopoda]|eukprot:XP_006836372.1 probable glutathione S-transferase parC [Amborella trichopoda]